MADPGARSSAGGRHTITGTQTPRTPALAPNATRLLDTFFCRQLTHLGLTTLRPIVTEAPRHCEEIDNAITLDPHSQPTPLEIVLRRFLEIAEEELA